MNIRKADKQKDYDKVWDIFTNVISTGDTYVFDPKTPKEALNKYWFADYMDTFVAVDSNDEILGTYIIKPNQIDLGDHIANCSYMVNPKFHRRGTGKLLCEHSIKFANKKALSNDCLEVYASNIIGGQWSLAICCYLINGKLRFGELRKCLPNITERMLTLQLRKLEENKIVKRTFFAEVPPRVEYELTEIGLKLKPIIEELGNWGKKHKNEIEKSTIA